MLRGEKREELWCCVCEAGKAQSSSVSAAAYNIYEMTVRDTNEL